MANSENKQLFEKATFNDYAYAKDFRDKTAAKFGRVKIGLIIATAATISSIIGFTSWEKLGAFGDFLFYFSVIGAIIAYIVGGGFGTALRWAFKIGLIGWIILPFPFDIATGLIFMAYAIFAFFFIPVFFVGLNFLQIKKDFKAVDEYMKYYVPEKPSQVTNTESTNGIEG